MTFNATALDNDFDTHLDVYNSNGTLLSSDEKAGHLSNAFTTTKAAPGQIFYVRIRGEQFANTNQISSGVFNLRIDGAATVVNLDPVTRRASVTAIAGKQDIQTYVFKTKGSGEGILTAVPSAPLPPIADPALGLYDKTGTRIAFNDDATDVGAAGVKHIVINLFYKPEILQQFLQQYEAAHSGLTIVTVREQTLLDTGGGIRNGLDTLPYGPFYIVSGDSFWEDSGPLPALAQMAREWDGEKMDMLLLLQPLKDMHPTAGTRRLRHECRRAAETRRRQERHVCMDQRTNYQK